VVTVAWDEELGSERVTDAQSEKGQPGTLETIVGHLLLILAERLPGRRLAEKTPVTR
jgi:hypothetical protein